ncbi:MAG: selenide, water dikinase SelD [Planctomycetaceae bacterium]
MRNRLPKRDVVLVGAGHTNMHVVRMFRMNPLADVRLTIVNAYSRATYSGMLPGNLAGLYSAEDMEIDLYRLAVPSGIRLIVDEATGLDAEKRRVEFRNRPPIRFDIASIGAGSLPGGYDRWSGEPCFLPIKPMATFRDRLEKRLAECECTDRQDSQSVQAVVVGAGAAGTEIALCLQTFLETRSRKAQITVVDGGSTILRGYEAKTVQRVTTQFQHRGINVRLKTRVVAVRGSAVEFDDGTRQAADIVLWATAAVPPPLLSHVNLPKAADGFLAVRPTLQTTAEQPVFAVGDSATLIESPVPRAGVFAVREGPVLWRNIRNMLKGECLQAYRQQDGFLSLLADGKRKAFVDYQGMSGHGRWAWQLKNYIDRRFMRMYQAYEPMPPVLDSDADSDTAEVMRCRGCGGKAGAGVLSAALTRLAAESATPDLHSALSGPEDAAMLSPETTRAELVSVDFFQAFLDDPWVVGRVAALNSLSDIWAMGARPYGALAMVQILEGHPRQQAELLYQVLSGALEEFSKAGVELLGGHTTEAAELTVGFTVLGTLDGVKPLRKDGLKPGQVLIVTKPLGTGTLLAGIPQAVTRGVWIDEMLKSMLKSNQVAAGVAREHNCTAMTDVTGFGLAGHLLEMLDGSGVSATLRLSDIPLLSGFPEVAGAGIESTLAPANRELEDRLNWDGADSMAASPEASALFDPQTSGGLLIAVRPEHQAAALQSLLQAGCPAAVIGVIGEESVTPMVNVIS